MAALAGVMRLHGLTLRYAVEDKPGYFAGRLERKRDGESIPALETERPRLERMMTESLLMDGRGGPR